MTIYQGERIKLGRAAVSSKSLKAILTNHNVLRMYRVKAGRGRTDALLLHCRVAPELVYIDGISSTTGNGGGSVEYLSLI